LELRSGLSRVGSARTQRGPAQGGRRAAYAARAGFRRL